MYVKYQTNDWLKWMFLGIVKNILKDIIQMNHFPKLIKNQFKKTNIILAILQMCDGPESQYVRTQTSTW